MSETYEKCYECPYVDCGASYAYSDEFWCSLLEKSVDGFELDPDCPLLADEDA